jgi:hypothetical protein
MPSTGLIAGIAGLAEGLGGYFSERHKLQLEKEAKKERDAATAQATAQQNIQNTLNQGRLKLEQDRLTDEAKWRKDKIDNDLKIAQIKASTSKDLLAAKTQEEAYKAAQDRAHQIAELGGDYDQALMEGMRVWEQATSTMPGMAPSGSVQPGNDQGGVNMPPPQVSNPAATIMSSVGRGIPSPIQNPTLQAGQPMQPQGMQLAHGMVSPNTALGAKIGLNQAQTKAAVAGIDEKAAQTEHIQTETEMLKLQAKIHSLEVPKQLMEMDKKLRKMDDDHILAKEEEKIKAATFDNITALAGIHAAQAHVAANMEKYKLLNEERANTIKGLEIEIKKGQLTGFTPAAADKGTKEAEDASKEKVSLAKDIASTKAATAFWRSLVERNGEPFQGKDARTQALNQMMQGAFVNYGENMKRLSTLQDQYVAANYHEAEGNYIKAMGTKVLNDSGKVDKAATEAAQSTARNRYNVSKEDYDSVQDKRQDQAHPELRQVDPIHLLAPPPGFTTERKHFTNGNTEYKATGAKKTKPKDPAEAFLEKHGYLQ